MTMNEERAQREIDILSKLLNADNSGRQTHFLKSVNAVYEEIRANFRPVLEESSVEDKDRICLDIINSVDSMDIFFEFPELIGKSFVGIFGLEPNLAEKFIAAAVGAEAAEKVRADSNIPAVFIYGTAGIFAVNDVGNVSQLSEAEYSDANRSLWRRGIDIRSFIRNYMITGKMTHKNIAFIYLPNHVRFAPEIHGMLIDRLDAAFVCTLDDYKLNKNKLLVNEIKKLNKAKKILLQIIADERDIKNCSFQELDKVRLNGLFADKIRLSMLEIREFYDGSIRWLQENRTKTASDLTKITTEDTKTAVTELLGIIRSRLNMLTDEKQKIDEASAALLDKVKKLETEINNKISGDGRPLYCEIIKETWLKIFLKAIDLKDIQLASEYTWKFQKAGDMLIYNICAMLLASAKGESPHHSDIEKLRYIPDSELTLRAKLRLRKEMNFSDGDCINIAYALKSIAPLNTPEEFYYYGRHCEVIGKRERAEDYYQRSLRGGYAPAGTRLFDLAQGSMRILHELAAQMVPEANFALGSLYMSEGKRVAANRHFKLAAVKEYIPAIKVLANELLLKLFKRNKPSMLFNKETEQTARRCANLYEHILSSEPNNADAKEKLGDIYNNAFNDARRALDWWQQCGTASAYYKMGKLFQYKGGAIEQDLDMADRYFTLAESCGYKKASAERKKIRDWIESGKQKKSEAEYRDYSPRVETGDYYTTSDGCFIIAAANSSLAMFDRWAWKKVIRWRNRLQKEFPVISVLLEEYYKIAPIIVERINAEANPKYIYRYLWNNFIAKAYALVCQGEIHEAANIYIAMMRKLCKRYSITLSDDITGAIDGFMSCNHRQCGVRY